jgi:hemerythrin
MEGERKMPYMPWSDDILMGVASLDAEHERLVALVNELHDAIEAGKEKEALGKVLDDLVDYTEIHLRHEEQLFVLTSYPEAAPHIKLHNDLTQRTLDIQARYKSGETGALSLEAMDFLKQ